MSHLARRYLYPVAVAFTGAVFILSGRVFPPLLTRTDYCPRDPSAFCTGPPPLMYVVIAVAILGAIACSAVAGREE